MNILDKIVADKRKEVELKNLIFPSSQYEHSVLTVTGVYYNYI